MGTKVAVVAPAPDIERAGPAVQELFETWEQTLSRFRPDSELSRLNHAGWGEVSPLLLSVIDAAIAAARRTHGVFDPTLLPHLLAAGYDQDFAALRDRASPPRSQPGPGANSPAPAPRAGRAPHPRATGAWRGLEVDPERRFVRLPEGAGLDLGGIAKGMAVDAASVLLGGIGVPWHAVDAGGDLRVAGVPDGQDSWPTKVEAGHGSVSIGLRSGALATSSVLGRRWVVAGEQRHHLIDPRTGVPARSAVLSVTAAAPTCEAADVAAKTALILGPEYGPALLGSLAPAGLITLESGRRIAVGGWPGLLDP
jgi:FAD:protein FMN transferase